MKFLPIANFKPPKKRSLPKLFWIDIRSNKYEYGRLLNKHHYTGDNLNQLNTSIYPSALINTARKTIYSSCHSRESIRRGMLSHSEIPWYNIEQLKQLLNN